METKTLTVITTLGSRRSLTFEVPLGIWFNGPYKNRGDINESSQITLSQFLTASNLGLVDTFKMMDTKTLAKFKVNLLQTILSKRGERVLQIIERVKEGI